LPAKARRPEEESSQHEGAKADVNPDEEFARQVEEEDAVEEPADGGIVHGLPGKAA
jgi:hypothetical protein